MLSNGQNFPYLNWYHATENLAKMLGAFHQKGALNVGSDADIAIFGKELKCRFTFVGGKELYQN